MNKEDFDAGDAVQVSKKQKKYSLQREQELEDLKLIISTRAGRALIWRILEWCGVYKISFTGNSTTFFNEGKRQVGLQLLDEILTADSSAYIKMQQEARDKESDRSN